MKRIMLALWIGLPALCFGRGQQEGGRPLSVRDSLPIDSVVYALQEVVVQSSSVKRKADRYVLSVPSSINKDGVELLRQAPGVWISDERISINGSSGTKVFVNNREIRLTGEMLTAYLHTLKSEDILRIEVVPMAGADKEANMQGGTIHFIMRRRTDRGMQGSLSLTSFWASSLQRYRPDGSLNFHSGKWDVYATASGMWMPENRGNLQTVRQYAVSGKDFTATTQMKQPVNYGTSRAGAVYTIDTLRQFGAELEYTRRSYLWHSQSFSFLSTGRAEIESRGAYRQEESYNMYSVAANYIRKLDAKGSVWKLAADYTLKDLDGNNRYHLEHRARGLHSDTVYRSRSLATYRIATADFSWKKQLRKKSFFRIGLRYTGTDMEDCSKYEGLNVDGSWRDNAAYGHEQDYDERIGAMYAVYSTEGKKGSIRIGMRGEYARISDRTNHRTKELRDWFPHVDASYYFDEIHKWMIVGQYGRYIERPSFFALNPNRIQTSDYTYQVGNPALRPTYIHKLSATLVYNYRYTLTVGGNLHRDLIREFGKEDAANTDMSYISYENHYRENHWFVAVNLPWQLVTWFNLSANAVGVRQDIRMYKENGYSGHFLFFGNASVVFFLPSDYSLEAEYSGASRLYSGNSEVAPFHALHLRLRKKWNDGRLTATLGVDNVFDRSNVYTSHLPAYTSVAHYSSASAGRVFKLSFSWNFNRGKKIKKVSVEKQSSEERKRLDGK